MAQKIFVKVVVEFDVCGKMMPKVIEWHDGRVFEIQKVLSVKTKPSFKCGGIGDRYEIIIGQKHTYLFFENGKWFVEGH